MSIPKHVPASSKLGRQAASASSPIARKERNKYAGKQADKNAAARVAWNAEVTRKLAEKKGRVWSWRLNSEGDGMVLVDRNNNAYPLQWAQEGTMRFVACASVPVPRALAMPQHLNETAAQIVDRIVLFLNNTR